MIKKNIITMFSFLFLFSLVEGFNSLYISTIVAEAYVLADSKPPQIFHKPIENISPLTKIAIIHGEVQDETQVIKVEIYYKNYGVVYWSTYTIIYNNLKSCSFYFQIPVNFITGAIEYQISAYDGFNSSYTTWYYVDYKDVFSTDVGKEGGSVVLYDGNPFDGETFIFIPEGALEKKVSISIKEVSVNSVPTNKKPSLTQYPFKVYKFEPAGLKFSKPVQLGLLYLDLDNNGIVDGSAYDEGILSIFWYDGVNWRNLRSSVDRDNNLVICWVNHFTYFGVYPLGSLSLDDYRPKERIITPNGDGINDVAIFDSIPYGTEIKIYDLRGRLVRKIDDLPYEWDGRDADGKDLEVGPYIYQFKVDGKLASGVIVIAR